MDNNKHLGAAFVLGMFVCIGLALLGYFIAGGMVKLKALERAITVKGLSEREVPANIAIWPIKFSEANNDLNQVFSSLQKKNAIIVDFLKKHGFQDKEISISALAILDRQSQQDGAEREKSRYSGESTITIYSENVDLVRNSMQTLVELGKQGIAISGEDYQSRTVAEKFAQDSKSQLGKIKSASQGQFSIEGRDSSTPYIKQVRVVSTVEYYLFD